MGCFVVERFPGSVVGFFHDPVNVLVGFILKTAAFGKVLPDQVMGIFI
jgi:hypothetical protein